MAKHHSKPKQNQAKQRRVLQSEHLMALQYLDQGEQHYQAYLKSHSNVALQQAIDALQSALELELKEPKLYLMLATTMWEQGSISLELAKEYCQMAISLDEQNWESHFTLATFEFQDGFIADALKCLNKSVNCNWFQSARASIFMAQVRYFQIFQTRTMGKKLQHLVQGSLCLTSGLLRLPFDTKTFGQLTSALTTDVGVTSCLAMAHGFKFIGLNSLYKTCLKLGSKVFKGETIFYQLLGNNALKNDKNSKQALEYFQNVLNQHPGHTEVLQELVKLKSDLVNTDTAKALLQKAIELNNNNGEAHYSLAQLYIEEKALIKALFHLKEAEKHLPEDPYVHSNMAYIMFHLDDHEGALAKYKHALEYGTNSEWISTVSQTVATIYQQIYHDKKHAVEYYQKSLENSPNNVDAWSQTAQLQFELGKMEEALFCYRHVLEFLPNNSECYCNIGYILWQLDQNDEAIDAYEVALSIDTNNAIAKNNLGVIYLDEKHAPEKAISLFESALNLKPDYTMASFNRARSLDQLGRNKEAAKAYTQTKALNAKY
jgi:tetratricopeptide (TPR) repeat protein